MFLYYTKNGVTYQNIKIFLQPSSHLKNLKKHSLVFSVRTTLKKKQP
jgi:hypothetical protein